MPHRRTLDRVSRPGLRFQGWRRLPAGSRIAVVILALIAAMAILAPVVAPYDPGDTGLAKVDDLTFTIKLTAPASDFAKRLGYAAYYPLPESAYADMAAFGQKPIGNGP
mgnify:CR=1 FL=1